MPVISDARGPMAPDAAADAPCPLVSVIVPAFNSAWCVARTLESIASQTYPNLEVIVVNDGSTDGTAAVVRSCIAGDARFRLVDQENRGLVGARNRGIDESRGSYIAPVDADDLWHPHYLASQVAMLEQADPDTPFVFCYSYWIDENADVYPTSAPARPPRSDFVGLLRENAVGNGSCAVFRREKLLEAGGYDPTLKPRGALGGEDWKLSLLLTARHPAAVNPQFLVGYRRTAGSLSADPTNQTRSLLIVLSDIREQVPGVAARHYWAARTDFLMWLLPRWAESGKWGQFAKYAALAFLGNPFWVFDKKARRNALTPAKMLIRRLLPLPARPAVPLRAATEIGLLPGALDHGAAQGPVRSTLAPRDMTQTAVSVIMCTRNRGDRLAAALDSIDRIEFGGEWEFILVDNGSTDGTQAVARAFAARTRIKTFRCVIEPGTGLSRARNRGIRESRGTLIAFTDDDCYPEPDWLRELTLAFQFEKIGFCGGQILLFDPTDAPITISWSDTPCSYPPNGFVKAGDIQGANMAFRREALEQIGLFDPAFGAGASYAAEDLDALWAASRNGWHGLYWPKAIVHHHHGRKTADIEGLMRGYMYGRGALVAKTLWRARHLKTGIRELGFVLTQLRHSPLPWHRKVYWEMQGFFAYMRQDRAGGKSRRGEAASGGSSIAPAGAPDRRSGAAE